MERPWGRVVHGGTSIGSMEVKLKDYLDGATVLFDAAGNVVDGRLQGVGGKGEKPESPASGNVSCQWRGAILAIVLIKRNQWARLKR